MVAGKNEDEIDCTMYFKRKNSREMNRAQQGDSSRENAFKN